MNALTTKSIHRNKEAVIPMNRKLSSVDASTNVIRWTLRNCCITNTDLAALSNVSTQWRKVTLELIQDMLRMYFNPEIHLNTDSADADDDPDANDDVGTWQYKTEHNKSSLRSSSTFNLSKLLLPGMAIEIIKRRLAALNLDSTDSRSKDPCFGNLTASFCLAWFHPSGIKTRTVELKENDSDDSSSDDENVIALASIYDINSLSECEHKEATNNRNMQTREKCMSSKFQTVADEWQGYQNAMDVLLPFGYSTVFVREVLQYAAEYNLKLASAPEASTPEAAAPDISESVAVDFNVNTRVSDDKHDELRLLKSRRTTFAVRGTTFARPHGYCLCVREAMRMPKLSAETRKMEMQDDKYQRRLYQSRRVRADNSNTRIRMRENLPRICRSTPTKNPDYQGPRGQLEGRRQRCIQFLNADKSRAVYMRTHPFDCGPVQGPITMFLVGIATEDGCFVSGLKRRFELGHLYGDGSPNSSDGMSPISMTTECASQTTADPYHASLNSSRRSSIANYCNSNNSGIKRDQYEEHGGTKCQCKIQEPPDSCDDEEESFNSDMGDRRIIRGTLGPGRWHLYTAVFNCDESLLRIDGVREPTDMLSTSGINNTTPILDGLTIGSDHKFDMSLCFGEASEGEGAGSIAELAVFSGAMELEDIQCFEKKLMKKHGIICGSTGFSRTSGSNRITQGNGQAMVTCIADQTEIKAKKGDQWQEDRWVRDVHSLMVHSPPFDAPSGGRIPLCWAARHQSVAWQRCCDVTGVKLRVSRIGSKLSTGSSDW